MPPIKFRSPLTGSTIQEQDGGLLDKIAGRDITDDEIDARLAETQDKEIDQQLDIVDNRRAYEAAASVAAMDGNLLASMQADSAAQKAMLARPKYDIAAMSDKLIQDEALDHADWPTVRAMTTEQRKQFVRDKRMQPKELPDMIPVTAERLARDFGPDATLNTPTIRANNAYAISQATGMDLEGAAVVYDSMVVNLFGNKEPTDIRPMTKLVRSWHAGSYMKSNGIDPAVFKAAKEYVFGDNTINWDVVINNIPKEQADLFYSYIQELNSPKARGFFAKTGETLARGTRRSLNSIAANTAFTAPEDSDVVRMGREQAAAEFKTKAKRDPFGIETYEVAARGKEIGQGALLRQRKGAAAMEAGDPVEGEGMLDSIWLAAMGMAPDMAAYTASVAITKNPFVGGYYWYATSSSDMYADMRDMGFDDATAGTTARITALPVAMINSLQMHQLVPNLSRAAMKKAEQVASVSITKYVASKTKQTAKEYATQISEEVLEGAFDIGGKAMAAALSEDAPEINWWEDVIRPNGEGILEAAKAFPLYVLGGKAIEVSNESRYIRKLQRAGVPGNSARAFMQNVQSGAFENTTEAPAAPKTPYTAQEVKTLAVQTRGQITALEADGKADSELADYHRQKLALLERGGNRVELDRLGQRFGIQEATEEDLSKQEEQAGRANVHSDFGTMADKAYIDEVVLKTNEILSDMGLTATVSAVDETVQSQSQFEKTGTRPTGSFRIDGDGKTVIELAFKHNEKGQKADIATAHHEALGHGLDVLLNASTDPRATEAKAVLDAEFGTDREAMATAAGEYGAKYNAGYKPKTVLEKAFHYIYEVLQSIKAAFVKQGFKTSDDVFRAALKGDFANREKNTQNAQDAAGSMNAGEKVAKIGLTADNTVITKAAAEKDVSRMTAEEQEAWRKSLVAPYLPGIRKNVRENLLPTEMKSQDESDKWNVQFEVKDKEAKEFSRQIDEHLAGNLPRTKPITMGSTPDVLTMLGAKELPITISTGVVDKILSESHGLTAEQLKELPYHLDRPIMVFESATHKGDLVLMTELTVNDKTVVAAVHLAKAQERHEVNSISSVHGKDRNAVFAEWAEKDLLRYIDPQKSLVWLQSQRVQFPREGAKQGLYKNIRFKSDLVKYEAEKYGGVQFETKKSRQDEEFEAKAEDFVSQVYARDEGKINEFLAENRKRAESLTLDYAKGDATAMVEAAEAATKEMLAARATVAKTGKGQRAAKKAADTARQAAIEATANIDQAMHRQNNRPRDIKDWEKIQNSLWRRFKSLKRGVVGALVPAMSRVEDISPETWQKMLWTEWQIKLRTSQMRQEVLPLAKKLQELKKTNKDAYKEFSVEWRDGNFTVTDRIAKEYGFEDEFVAAKAIFDAIFKMANEVGMDIQYAQGYGPRHITDTEGFMAFIEGHERHSALLKAIEAAESPKGKNRTLDKDEKARLINSLIRGFSSNGIMLARPGHAKERSIEDTGGEIADFYADPEIAMFHYIDEMNSKIAWREFFGKETKELVALKAQKSRLMTRLNSLTGRNKGNVFVLGKGWQELNEIDFGQHVKDAWKQLEETVVKIKELDHGSMDKSIGRYIQDAVDSGEIKASKAAGSPGKRGKDLAAILKAIIEPKGISGELIKDIRNAGYVTTLANPFSAMAQLKDIGMAADASKHWWQWLPEAAKTIARKENLKLEEMGLGAWGEEISADTAGRAVEETMKWSGFTYGDRLGKSTLINTVVAKYQREASQLSDQDIAAIQAGNKPRSDMFKNMVRYFGENKAGEAIRDFRSGQMTDRVKFAAFIELAERQPITMSGMPEYYAKAGNLRILYMMRTFNARRINFIYRKSIKEMSTKETFAHGAKRFVQLMVTLGAFDVGIEVLKQLAQGKDPQIEDVALDSMAQYVFFSRYTYNSVRREGMRGLFTSFAPPTKPIDWALKHKPEDFVRTVPIFGEPYYWWFGAGSEK